VRFGDKAAVFDPDAFVPLEWSGGFIKLNDTATASWLVRRWMAK
jgi:hypothetical protein